MSGEKTSADAEQKLKIRRAFPCFRPFSRRAGEPPLPNQGDRPQKERQPLCFSKEEDYAILELDC